MTQWLRVSIALAEDLNFVAHSHLRLQLQRALMSWAFKDTCTQHAYAIYIVKINLKKTVIACATLNQACGAACICCFSY